MNVRQKTAADQPWIEETLERFWGGRIVVAHGEVFEPASLPALIAGERQGIPTYSLDPPAAEIVTINSLEPRRGIGTALVEALAAELAAQGVRELRVCTTNDNLDTLRFYQRRGFHLAALRPGAVEQARLLKASIPRVGNFGIPRHDELERARPLP